MWWLSDEGVGIKFLFRNEMKEGKKKKVRETNYANTIFAINDTLWVVEM